MTHAFNQPLDGSNLEAVANASLFQRYFFHKWYIFLANATDDLSTSPLPELLRQILLPLLWYHYVFRRINPPSMLRSHSYLVWRLST